MARDELAAWLRLTLTPGVGNTAARKLLATFGLPQTLFTQSAAALEHVVTPAQAAQLRREPPELGALLETTWNWLQAGHDAADTSGQRRIVVLADPDYPAALLNMEDPPLMLYLLGAGSLAVQPAVAMVGSRNPTPQGLLNARQFARALGEAGVTVVSGMALGIDGAAHEGALEGPGATIAVVGTGLDRVYPKSHRDLAHRITRRGLILSEYPLGTPPLSANFPKRNRLIAGLTQGTLVVEATLNSGSLITARLAADQGKEVFAIPGSIHAVQSRGCHALIRQGAKLVESVQDILEDMKLEVATNSVAAHADSPEAEGLFNAENALLEALGFDPVSLDALQARTGLDTPHLQAQLMALELEGHVARLPGGLFQRQAQA